MVAILEKVGGGVLLLIFVLFQAVKSIDSLVIYHVLVAYYHVNFMLLLAHRLLLF